MPATLSTLIDLSLFRRLRFKNSSSPFSNEVVSDGACHPKLFLQFLPASVSAAGSCGRLSHRRVRSRCTAFRMSSLPSGVYSPSGRMTGLAVTKLVKLRVSGLPNESLRVFTKLVEFDLSI